ncbi:hypothetical protein TNCV_4520101 [Trichonephila clavipes]|nr:hypothetical protein TNCV_4520101 [Trichonephila clavipes]
MVSDSGQSWPLYGEVVPDNEFGRIKKKKRRLLIIFSKFRTSSLEYQQQGWVGFSEETSCGQDTKEVRASSLSFQRRLNGRLFRWRFYS